MNLRSMARSKWTFAMLLALIEPLHAREASAYMVLHINWGSQWLVVCNDGTNLAVTGSYGYAAGVANVLCGNHGGVANITDAAVTSALATIQTCDAVSTIVVARDLGGGNYEALTMADIAARLAQSQGNPVELVGYQLRSVNLGGIELHPNPVGNLPTIPISQIFSDEFETGEFVGGRTVPESCSAAVPNPPWLAPLLGLLMAALGVWSLVTRRPVTRTA